MIKANQSVFDAWMMQPENTETYQKMLSIIQGAFPEAISYTVADEQGNALWDDMGETLGELCLTDLKKHVTQRSGNNTISYIHPGPKHYHYDLFVPLQNTEHKQTLLVSFGLNTLVTQLTNQQTPFHQMYITRNTPEGDLIELSSEGTRQQIQREFRFNASEQALITQGFAARLPIKDTDWFVIDITDTRYLEHEAKKLKKWYWVIL